MAQSFQGLVCPHDWSPEVRV